METTCTTFYFVFPITFVRLITKLYNMYYYNKLFKSVHTAVSYSGLVYTSSPQNAALQSEACTSTGTAVLHLAVETSKYRTC